MQYYNYNDMHDKLFLLVAFHWNAVSCMDDANNELEMLLGNCAHSIKYFYSCSSRNYVTISQDCYLHLCYSVVGLHHMIWFMGHNLCAQHF